MFEEKHLDKLTIIANEQVKEKEYWLNKLAGEIVKSSFPYDFKKESTNSHCMDAIAFEFPGQLFSKIEKLSGNSPHTLYVILTAGLVLLLEKYTGRKDVFVGAPIFKQNAPGKLINKILVLRHHLNENTTFKQLLLLVKQTFTEAMENRDYPVEFLAHQLGAADTEQGDDFPLFDVAILLENIHDKHYLNSIKANITFSFLKNAENIEGRLEYNSSLYRRDSIEKISLHFKTGLEQAFQNLDAEITDIGILSPEDKEQILRDFNDTGTEYPKEKSIPQLFVDQVRRTPDKIAVDGPTIALPHQVTVTYKELNTRAAQLAGLIQQKGVKANSIVGIMLERSVEMIIAALAVLKTGAAYLPLDSGNPGKRVKYMLDDADAPLLLTNNNLINKHSFIDLQGLQAGKTQLHLTKPRPQITDLEKQLPIPDRSLISYEKYNRNIGMAMAKHTLALQASRGCPYKCIYCHKIWPKTHVCRSAQHIFEEVQLYYNMGLRRFVIVDDIFNLNKKNSSDFFKLVIKNKMDLQLFFPNGMRGDILTKDYIDLMMEAGTVNLALALETASPRLQKVIGKNLAIDKLHDNMDYICKQHPQVISELFTMHGFPGETEADAQLTMDFIKSLKWLHLPHVNILKIYPNTEMADLAIKNGISPDAIARSENLAFHQLPETLPFEESFTMEYQTEYLDYFLSKERLLHVLPYQMKTLTRDEILQKYNSFLPTPIGCLDDLFELAGITREEFGPVNFLDENHMAVEGLDAKMNHHFAPEPRKKEKKALNVLLMDLSQFFSGECDMLYDVSEPPLGLMYLMTYLNKTFGGKVNGKILKSRTDYDNYGQLKALLEEFKPDIIGLRTLTFFNQFFHKTVSMIRSWGFDAPIIAGGPYATSDYKRILQDRNIDIVAFGEGEITFSEIIGKVMENNGKLPPRDILKEIQGIAFASPEDKQKRNSNREILLLDEFSSTANPVKIEEPVHSPDNPAYTMYTSGSTGQPKAVMVNHQNIIRLVKNTKVISLTDKNRLLQTAPLEFDASTIEIWGTLLNGASFFLTDENSVINPDFLKESIRKHGITTMWMTSPLFNRMVETDCDMFAGLKQFIIGGDTLSPDHIHRLKSRFPDLNVINGYGPTENTTFSTTFLIDDTYKLCPTIPIGKPTSNSSAYIMDGNQNLLPVGIPGQLYVGGDGVARGYLNNPELTQRKFTDNPFVESDRLYDTGDIARWLPDGNIEFAGRADFQVKIRGIRIELGEIEKRLLSCDGVAEAVVLAGNDKNDDKNLCAYIVLKKPADTENAPASPPQTNPSLIKAELSENLPDYMVPAFFTILEEIPLTPSGKVDRKAFPEPEITAGKDYVAPGNYLESTLVDIWSDVLDIDKEAIGINANFFDL
ncbi:MAG: amino acid adenylation domain-containing protein, partial [bacterium]|nr:amino acid adenylation domain-containing protein [bacterium]